MAWYARIQDNRFPVPRVSSNWRREQDEAFIDVFGEGSKLPATMGGLSVFCDIRWAVKDLLGRCSADGENPCYAAAIEEDGGTPVLVLINGEDVADDVGVASVIDPDLSTERRFSVSQVWDAIMGALSPKWPEERAVISRWSRTPSGFLELCEEYDLLNSIEAVEIFWPAVEQRLLEGSQYVD